MSKNSKQDFEVSRAISFLGSLLFPTLVTVCRLSRLTPPPTDIDLIAPAPGLFATSGQAIQRRMPLPVGEVSRSGRVFHRR